MEQTKLVIQKLLITLGNLVIERRCGVNYFASDVKITHSAAANNGDIIFTAAEAKAIQVLMI